MTATLKLITSKGDSSWAVYGDEHQIAGPFMVRALAVEWIYENGFRQIDGDWIRESRETRLEKMEALAEKLAKDNARLRASIDAGEGLDGPDEIPY